MDGWTVSFIAMRVALGGAATRRRTLQPAPPQPTMATRARSSPTPSLHVSGTPAHRESPEIKDCHSRTISMPTREQKCREGNHDKGALDAGHRGGNPSSTH